MSGDSLAFGLAGIVLILIGALIGHRWRGVPGILIAIAVTGALGAFAAVLGY